MAEELAQLPALAQRETLVLLDYETNSEVSNLAKPLSHAGLVMHYLQDSWPVPQDIWKTLA